MKHPDDRPIALGARLKKIPKIRTLGFRPCFHDYTPDERRLILDAETIYYPTAFYSDLFHAMGKKIFPSFHTYSSAADKIRQTAIFQVLGLPHPRTRVFYGPRQKKTIPDHFCFPFIAKTARGSGGGRGVFLIRNEEDLAGYLLHQSPAYIQEYLPSDRDIRVVVIGKKIRLAYWRIASPAGFRTNVSQGGTISFDPVPKAALDLALLTALKCGWDDVGIDILFCRGRSMVLEGNMKYGTRGFRKAGVDYHQLLADLIIRGEV